MRKIINKNKKRTHNRPFYGPFWWVERLSKEEAKQNRKYMKGIRHKLLFHIPLTEDEQKTVDEYGLTSRTGLNREGFPSTYYDEETQKYTTRKWRFFDPKEESKNK